jgi:hypothetical protein
MAFAILAPCSTPYVALPGGTSGIRASSVSFLGGGPFGTR